ncbi:MAG: hypothetical protein GW748_00020 [Alphaproteobacteria bacterium]|nr:hypothetical protein [Alphaproteobacteria bacterium]
MDLKDFILETISSIADATSDLQEKYSKEGIIINPPADEYGKGKDYKNGDPNYTIRRVQNINFDVAVTAYSEQAGGGKAIIKVMSVLELDSDGKKSISAEQVSRVSFEVPMTLKPSKNEAENMKKAEKNRSYLQNLQVSSTDF